MFTTEAFFTVLEMDTNPLATLILSGGDEDTTVKIEAFTKTPTGGHAPVELGTVTVPTLSTVTFDIPPGIPADPTFPQGYGAIRARSINPGSAGVPESLSSAPFIAYLSIDGLPAMFPITGTPTKGPTFRMPYVKPPTGVTQSVKVALTNLGSPQLIHIRNPLPLGFKKSVTLDTFESFQWDSVAQAVNMNKSGILEVAATGGGDVIVSATTALSTGTLTRTYPARLI